MTHIAHVLDTLAGRSLTRSEATGVFTDLVGGRWSELEVAGLLGALKARGETPEEIAGAAQALRNAAKQFPRPDYLFADTCGTGGDGRGTLNVSTAAAIVAAELGIPVAKHGNRAVSSKCGSADVLEAAGVRLETSPAQARRCLDDVGLCFLFAPHYHAGVRHAMPVRKAFGTRTIFNLLGPLANPARPPVQIVGVYDPALCRPLALTLAMLGADAALVVHGDGLDEIALHGATRAVLYRDGCISELELTPEEAGLPRQEAHALTGGEPHDNAAAMCALLAGRENGAYRDAVALNAGALAWVAGRSPTLAEGATIAREALTSGRAGERLERWIEVSHGA
ncbi:MAG: anthranilate phosphoribosyltransferase [Acidobacteriota bacterium]|nr:anthranilate phosphoribosyltransferase [Acidobacteriota bacterium]